MSWLTSAGAVLDLVVEKLGDEDHICEDVEHPCNYLREGHGCKGQTQICEKACREIEGLNTTRLKCNNWPISATRKEMTAY